MRLARLGRIILAIPITAIVPGCAFLLFSGSFPIGALAFIYSTVLGFFLGVPLLIMFQFRYPIKTKAVAVGGFIVATIPIGFFTWPVNLAMKTTTAINGIATVINGVPTLEGWFKYFKGLLVFGVLGILSGLVFYWILKTLGDPLTPSLSNTFDERPKTPSNI